MVRPTELAARCRYGDPSGTKQTFHCLSDLEQYRKSRIARQVVVVLKAMGIETDQELTQLVGLESVRPLTARILCG